jgi:Sec-independent protein translocase protein TatA
MLFGANRLPETGEVLSKDIRTFKQALNSTNLEKKLIIIKRRIFL